MIEVHEARTEAGSNPLPDTGIGSKHCVFQYGDSRFALVATAVREVTHAPPLVRVPCCPPSLAGLCHLRSEFVPVVHLGPLLGQREIHVKKPGQLLVLHSVLGPWALMIDRAISIETIETHIDAVGRGDGQRSGVLGTATYQSQVVRVLDPQALHQLVQQSRHRQWETSHQSESGPPKLSVEEVA